MLWILLCTMLYSVSYTKFHLWLMKNLLNHFKYGEGGCQKSINFCFMKFLNGPLTENFILIVIFCILLTESSMQAPVNDKRNIRISASHEFILHETIYSATVIIRINYNIIIIGVEVGQKQHQMFSVQVQHIQSMSVYIHCILI